MKNLLNILILIPLLIYILLLLINKNLLLTTQEINIFWLYKTNIQFILYINIFFILYLILIWWLFKFSNLFANHKTKKLNDEILKLKSKLTDQTPELIEWIQEILNKKLEEFKTNANKQIELTKKETEKVLWNLEYEIKTLKDKIEKLSKIKN